MRLFLKVLAFCLIAYASVSFRNMPGSPFPFPFLSASFDSIGKQGIIYTTVTISNHTKDTIRFSSMSCLYPDYYTCDNKEISIPGVPCDKNIPVIITLAPHQSDVKKLRLKSTVEWKKLQSVKFRIGFRYSYIYNKDTLIAIDSFDGKEHKYKSRTSNEIIIYSNELTIK